MLCRQRGRVCEITSRQSERSFSIAQTHMDISGYSAGCVTISCADTLLGCNVLQRLTATFAFSSLFESVVE